MRGPTAFSVFDRNRPGLTGCSRSARVIPRDSIRPPRDRRSHRLPENSTRRGARSASHRPSARLKRPPECGLKSMGIWNDGRLGVPSAVASAYISWGFCRRFGRVQAPPYLTTHQTPRTLSIIAVWKTGARLCDEVYRSLCDCRNQSNPLTLYPVARIDPSASIDINRHARFAASNDARDTKLHICFRLRRCFDFNRSRTDCSPCSSSCPAIPNIAATVSALDRPAVQGSSRC